MGSTAKPYTLYTAPTPNGWKASVTFEELKAALGLEYNLHPINIMKDEQKEEWYLKINPNGKIPAMVDHEEGDFPVFESGAIMLYLAEKHPDAKLLPLDRKGKAEVTSWLMFQMGGLGPMMGQANFFVHFSPDDIPAGVNRYTKEVQRLLGVMNAHLAEREWLAAGQYTIADIANYCWAYGHDFAGVSIAEFPHLKAWMARVGARPAVRAGMDVPVSPNPLKGRLTNAEFMKRGLGRLEAVAQDNPTAAATAEKLRRMLQGELVQE